MGRFASRAFPDVNELTVHADASLVQQRYLDSQDLPSSHIDARGLLVFCVNAQSSTCIDFYSRMPRQR